jgi:hypothetical protein
MATVTSIGPIGARQINNNLYVGRSDLTTIQSAVTAAVAIGSSCVVIPAGYTGADAISAITGGNAAVYLSDQRGTSPQNYTWNGTNYVPADFVQAQGFVTKGQPAVPAGSAALYYVPTGTNGAGTAHIDFAANPGMGMPSLNFNGVPSDGSPFVTFMRLQAATSAPGINVGVPEVEMPSQLSLFNGSFDSWNAWIGDFYLPGNKGMTIWARSDENAIDFQGETIGGAYDQTIRLNYLGGNVQIGPIIFSAIGDIVGVGDIAASSIAADDADFDTCEVNNSPVRTFANTPDGPGEGMVWPPDGVPVSLGDHWQNPSIDPTTLATWPSVGIPVSTGTAWGTSIAASSLATWPAAGVPVSTGSAWGTPIDPATIPRLNVANSFTAVQTVIEGNAYMRIRGNVTAANIDTTHAGLTTSWNLSQGISESSFINVGALASSGGFGWYNTWVGGPALDPTKRIMFVDSGGSLTILGGLTTTSNASVLPAVTAPPNGMRVVWNLKTGTGETDFINSNGGVGGGFHWYNVGAGTTLTSTTVPSMRLDSNQSLFLMGGGYFGNSVIGVLTRAEAVVFAGANINSDGTNLFVTAPGSGITYFNWDSGTGGVIFGNGHSASVGSINGAGGATFATLSVAGTKNFRIHHPLNEEKDLVHACLEGPENGVFYRGEGVTDGGWAEITLPDYFEALVKPEDRSVLLTALFEDEAEQVGMLAAGRVKDGKFKVWSALPAQKFYWEVKAVRGDIEALEIEPPRAEPHRMRPEPEQSKGEETHEGVK